MAPGRLRRDDSNSASDADDVSPRLLRGHDLVSDTPNAATQCKLTVYFPPPSVVSLDGKIGHVVVKLDPAPLRWHGIQGILTLLRAKPDEDDILEDTLMAAGEWKAHRKRDDSQQCDQIGPCILNQGLQEVAPYPVPTGYNAHPFYFVFQDVQIFNPQNFHGPPIKMKFKVKVEGCNTGVPVEDASVCLVECDTMSSVWISEDKNITKEQREYTKEEYEKLKDLHFDVGSGTWVKLDSNKDDSNWVWRST
ncbi:hypothetical protein B0H65DRAFT_176606 [Neurospora tetraspora]|uniref:Uncharacterized protein n=1 Tax=Neurospora tetraspora TaxID=94610 RepID=A0AAE0JIG7_9PEZI|nr:hypothetical protein B0H65DRAFT_176606 [Neurospora tetraspora]